MCEMGLVTVSLWPATPLLSSVACELGRIGIDVRRLPEPKATLELTHAGQGGLRLELHDCGDGLSDVEALLATLRLAKVNYVAWDLQGRGCRFESWRGSGEAFAVSPDGRAVITRADLDRLDGARCGDVLLDLLRGMVGRATPPFAGHVSRQTMIVVCDDDDCGHPGSSPTMRSGSSIPDRPGAPPGSWGSDGCSRPHPS